MALRVLTKVKDNIDYIYEGNDPELWEDYHGINFNRAGKQLEQNVNKLYEQLQREMNAIDSMNGEIAEYNSDAVYQKHHVVFDSTTNKNYRSLVDGNRGFPLNNTTYWKPYKTVEEIVSAISEINEGNIGAILPITDKLSKLDVNTPVFKKVNATTIHLKAGTAVQAGGTLHTYSVDTNVILPTLTPGEDYAIYALSNGTLQAFHDPFNSPAVVPAGSQLIGGFHYSMTSPTETIASGQFATTGAGMIWTQSDVNKIRGINEYSIWDIKFRRSGIPNIPGHPRHQTISMHGFALDPNTKTWVGIYYTSTDTDTNGLSRANSNVASGTVAAKIPKAYGGNGIAVYTARGGLIGPGNWWDLQEVLASQGARHPYEFEFNSFAFGTTEGIVLGGSAVTIPTTKREPKYTSRIGIEQVSGHHYIWGMDSSFREDGTVGWAWNDVTGGRGQYYMRTTLGHVKAIFGSPRSAANAGSRTVGWADYPWYSVWHLGCRACDSLCIL